MAIVYTHRQFSRATVVSLLAMGAVLIAVLTAMGRALIESPVIIIAVAMPVLVALAAHLAMLSLTVTLSDHELMWSFGLGFWRKRILRSDITRVQRIRLPWWYGIGIKYTSRGWAYLVAPGDGIEIALANGEVVLIGTDDVTGLMTALGSRSSGAK